MESSSRVLADFFRSADEVRREQGRILDALGFRPLSTPSRTVRTWRSAQLLAYQAPNPGHQAILLVPAPIKTAYIWDLSPGSSVIERCISAGLQPYLVVWQRPRSGDEWMGLAEYADAALHRSVNAIAEETGQAQVVVSGHSLGGTLAAIFSSLHPDRVRALIELEGPMEFGAGCIEAVVASAPPAQTIADPFGNVPGSFLTWSSVYADPITFNAEPILDWLESNASSETKRLHWQVRRWSLDETPMARRLFEEVADALYRQNRFARRGLRVGGQLADPRALDMPILAVVNPRSRIVPWPSIDAYRTRAGSKHVHIVRYAGDTGVMIQHVGVLVGSNAHRLLWPHILRWIQRIAPLD
jgi:polyhydroxyalkanoate synthase subunit PhaC